MSATFRRPLQCQKCPWKRAVDPNDIPGGYDPEKHRALACTDGGDSHIGAPLRMMACHESEVGDEYACVGWLRQQLGPGNNLGLRLQVMFDRDAVIGDTVGDQYDSVAEMCAAADGEDW